MDTQSTYHRYNTYLTISLSDLCIDICVSIGEIYGVYYIHLINRSSKQNKAEQCTVIGFEKSLSTLFIIHMNS